MKIFRSFAIHLILSMFFLPMLLIYGITGVMYMAGVDQQWSSSVKIYELDASDKAPYEASCQKLQSLGVTLPAGKVKNFKGRDMLGSSSSEHIIFNRVGDSLQAEVVSPGIYPKLMLAHKGKTGMWFNILGYGAALTLVILYISGVCMVWKNARRRMWMLASAGAGLLAVIIGYLMM